MQVANNHLFTPPHYNSRENDSNEQDEIDFRKNKKKRGEEIILIIFILLFTGLTLSLRAFNREPVSDDILYRYILDNKPLGSNDYSTKVESLKDALTSQKNQYFHSNGRFIVHVFVQMFASPWGHKTYSIFLGLLGVAVIILFNRVTVYRRLRTNPFIWLLISFSYLYLFQRNSGNWYSIVGGMNYMYPMLFILIFLFLLRYIQVSKPKVTPLSFILLSILGIFTGWSQECYSFPLSGGILFYYITRYRTLNKNSLILIFTLWIGTAILVLAPGNFVRLSHSKGIIITFINGLELLYGTVLFWLLIISSIILRISSKELFKAYIQKNKLIIYTLVLSIFLGLVANTLPQSFNGVSFYSAILLFKLINNIQWERLKTSSYIILTVSVLLPMGIHQYRIIKYSKITKEIYHNFIMDYISSENGIMPIPSITLPKDVQPFLKIWFNSATVDWTMSTISKVFGEKNKPLVLLKDEDLEAFENKETFIKEIKPINNDFYPTKDYIWFDNNLIMPGDSLELQVVPIEEDNLENLLRMAKRKLTNSDPQSFTITLRADSPLIIGLNNFVGIRIKKYEIKNVTVIRY